MCRLIPSVLAKNKTHYPIFSFPSKYWFYRSLILLLIWSGLPFIFQPSFHLKDTILSVESCWHFANTRPFRISDLLWPLLTSHDSCTGEADIVISFRSFKLSSFWLAGVRRNVFPFATGYRPFNLHISRKWGNREGQTIGSINSFASCFEDSKCVLLDATEHRNHRLDASYN